MHRTTSLKQDGGNARHSNKQNDFTFASKVPSNRCVKKGFARTYGAIDTHNSWLPGTHVLKDTMDNIVEYVVLLVS